MGEMTDFGINQTLDQGLGLLVTQKSYKIRDMHNFLLFYKW